MSRTIPNIQRTRFNAIYHAIGRNSILAKQARRSRIVKNRVSWILEILPLQYGTLLITRQVIYIFFLFKLTSQRAQFVQRKKRKEHRSSLCAYLDNYAGDLRQCARDLLLRIRANKCTIFIATSQSGIMRILNNGQALQNNSRCWETTALRYSLIKHAGDIGFCWICMAASKISNATRNFSVRQSPRIGIKEASLSSR